MDNQYSKLFIYILAIFAVLIWCWNIYQIATIRF